MISLKYHFGYFATALLAIGLFIFSLLVQGAQLPKASPNATAVVVKKEILLVPLNDFPLSVLNRLAEELPDYVDLPVRIANTLHFEQLEFIPGKEQYSVGDLIELVGASPQRTRYSDTLATIALTTLDINDTTSNVNYWIASHNHQKKIAVISSARLKTEYSRASEDAALYHRLLKMVMRAVGELHYRYPRTQLRRDVMYAPILSVKDIDVMGRQYAAIEKPDVWSHIPKNGVNCNLAVPPRGSEVAGMHGLDLVYPPSRALKDDYTGCQVIWNVGIEALASEEQLLAWFRKADFSDPAIVQRQAINYLERGELKRYAVFDFRDGNEVAWVCAYPKGISLYARDGDGYHSCRREDMANRRVVSPIRGGAQSFPINCLFDMSLPICKEPN